MEHHVRSFAHADEHIELPGLVSRVVTIGSLGVAHNVHAPGWRWSVDVRSSVRTPTCEVRHVGYVISGRLAVELRDRTRFEVGPGEVFDIPPFHDGWVVGDEVFESIEWLGARSWLAELTVLRERVLATIVFVDVVGSTATARRLGEPGWSDLLATFEHAMADVIGTYSGRVVKLTGDGVLAIFTGTARALRAARAMRTSAEDLGLPIRAAVHTAEIELTDEDIHGVAVHEAARMLDLAVSGDILVSATTRLLSDDARLTFAARGTVELRDVPGVRELFALA